MEDINHWQEKFNSCIYSEKLLKKLERLNAQTTNKIDILEVKKAIYYAKKYHEGQKRKSGEDYYSHPLEVAYMVADYLFKTDIIITSILHDTIEDTTLTYYKIKIIFGPLIADQVEGLTRVKESGKISSATLVEGLWNEKKYDLLLIKQFDRLHNMLTIEAKSPEKIKKTTEETLRTFLILAASLGTRDIEEIFTRLCIEAINKVNTLGIY